MSENPRYVSIDYVFDGCHSVHVNGVSIGDWPCKDTAVEAIQTIADAIRPMDEEIVRLRVMVRKFAAR